MTSGLLRASAVYGLANALSAGVPFLLLPILTRALTPGEYGVVVTFFLVVSLSTSLAGLNVHSAVSVKWLDRAGLNFPRYVGSALVLALLSTALCALLLTGAGMLWHERVGLGIWLWPLAALMCGCTVLSGIRTTLWQSQRKALPSALLQVGTAVLNMSLSLLAVLTLSMGADGRIGAALCTGLLAAGLGVWLLMATGDAAWSLSIADLRKLMRFGFPLIPHALAGAVLASADRFAVSTQWGTDALGVYGAAAQIGMTMNVLSDALVKAFSPWMYAQMFARSSAGRLRVVAATYLLIPVWLILALTLWLLFIGIGPLILGPSYQDAIGLSIWFLLGGAMSAIYLNIAGLFFFTSRNEWLSLASVATAIVAVGLAPMLASRFGLVGAAVAYLCSQSLLLALAWLLSTRVQPMPWHRPLLAWRVLRRTGGAR